MTPCELKIIGILTFFGVLILISREVRNYLEKNPFFNDQLPMNNKQWSRKKKREIDN